MARKHQPEAESRLARGHARPDARFPVAPPQAALPEDYAAALAAIRSRIQQERLRVVLSASEQYMRAFAPEWPERELVQQTAARIPSDGEARRRLGEVAGEHLTFVAAWTRGLVQEPLARITCWRREKPE